ncbi:8249_t:CDS:2 [Funneliformis geosporum]|uniref:17681_t:CDS:1 n=1 Tax=Funneliformis geosporum TaxID=1117311 RepID=A0A9W4SGG5_9GLOM|nr:8249_t:CDS:2 [Funneliformis geosporum]CAI2168566.1 17681_t:CDS:2 [Funneliformis geosporum]
MASRPKGLKVTDFVERPCFGRNGREIRVRANFFEVTAVPEANIHHYDIAITPEVPPSLNRKIYKQFEFINCKNNNILPVYDGRKNIFTSSPLPFGEAASFEVNLQEDDGSTSSKRPPRTFKIKFKKVNEINMEELQRFLDGKSQLNSNILTGIMALDVLIRHQPSMKYVTVGRSFYTPEGSRALSGGVEVWQGYYQSARPTPGKMMINIDLSATAFHESGSLINVVLKLLGKRSIDDLRRGINERERVKLDKELKLLKIRVIHRGESNSKRSFKISKISPLSAQQTKFDDADGHKTDVLTYFQKTYNKHLTYPHLPCVIVKKDISLPMEICEVIEGQRQIRKLNEKQTADMIKFTCQQPHIRANKIKAGLEILNYRNNDQMTQFNMKVSNEMALVQARVLPTPTINYHTSSKDASFTPREGSWNLRDKKVAEGATLRSWSVLVFGTEPDFPMQSVQNFVRELVIVCSDTGMNIPTKTPPIIHKNAHSDIGESLKQAWIRAGNAAKSQPQLILCILPNTGVQLYGSIKCAGDTIIGVVTQCIQSKHMFQAKKQYCANVCLKINVKLGGMNSFLTPKQNPFLAEKPSILMGADVSHPSPGSNRPSIAALCASMDSKAVRYAAAIRRQDSRTEIIADLANMVKDMLKAFYKNCGRKPERILFYRDGVSEGQFAQVLEGEISAVKAACRDLDQTYSPTITFVVVQKRHHARFFPVDKKDSDRTGNCLPGTLVEKMVVHPVEFDFYLQSQAGLQGTCRPTHYHVLYDQNSFTPDSLQTLSYNLCYIYARCTRAVSLVPPVYYAHIVCSRARFHAHGDNFSEDSSVEGEVTFGKVLPELLKVMYFM